MTTFHGFFVVLAEDPVKSIADLGNHKIIFGPEYTTEKRIEPIKMLKAAGIAVPEKPEFVNTCKEAVLQLIDQRDFGEKLCAMISDYAIVLLEGCQTIEKGSLRVLEKTPEVPFITAFASGLLDDKTLEIVRDSLDSFGKTKDNLIALESKSGFVPVFDRNS